MKISVRFFAALREIAGKREETLKFSDDANVTVEKALKALVKLHGKDFSDYVYDGEGTQVRGYLQLLVNEKTASMKTRLKDGDVLVIVPPVGGG